jgi:dipeptidyl aminopeptidase/acylaminoacyl peptidase
MDENGSDQALRRRVAQLNEAIDGDGPRRPPLVDVLAGAARRPAHRGIRTSLTPGLAAAGIIVVVLAIVFSGFTRQPVGPAVTSRSSAQAPGSPSVTKSQPPASSLPTATASVTPAPTTDPRAVSFTKGSSLGEVRWAPDGKTFALLDESQSADLAVIHFFSRAGKSLGDIPGRNLAWIDANRYIVLRWPDADPGAAQAFIGRVGQTVLTQIPGVYGYGEDMLGNGHGAVALPLPSVNEQYVVWSDGRLSQPRPGWPVAWSNDGQELAVLYDDQSAVQSWFYVVGLAGQRIAAVDVGEPVEGLQVLFSPDGRNVALSAGPGSLPCILNIPTGRTVSMGSAPAISIAWASDTRLLTVAPDPIPRFLTEWDLAGKSVQIPAQAGDLVSVPNAGVVALVQEDLSDLTGAPGALVLLDPPKEPTRIGFAGQIGLPYWSPDGKIAVVISYYPSNSTEAFFITP